MSKPSHALGCGIVFLLITALGATYGLWSFHQECRNKAVRIVTEQDAVQVATRILLEKATPMQLSLASDKTALAKYISQHPDCCTAEREFSIVYWDYLWQVDFSLKGVVELRQRSEDMTIRISSCGYYDSMNWMSDH